MFLEKLSEKDRNIIFQCMNSLAKGNFLEGEYHSRLGLELEKLEEFVSAYPQIDDASDDSDETLAINNCLNEVSNGVKFSDKEWSKWFTFRREDVLEVYHRWAKLRGWTSTGIM